MKYVSPLSSDIESMLHEAVSGCPHQRVRQRAQAILWSAMGYSRRDIADLSFVVPIVVSHWLDHWEKAGLSGLYDAPRSGRPPIYTAIDGVHLKAFLDESPQQLRQAQAQLIEQTGKSSCLDTVKRLLKKTPIIAGNAVVAR
jgi:transposase